MHATLIGLSAILMWSLLALFTALSGEVQPFQLAAMCFSVAASIGLISLATKPSGFRNLRQPLRVWFLGVGGLIGYHFFYFTALRNAPAVEASLIGYLWPLLIVIGSALLPGERIGWHHVTGTLAGLAGTVLIISKNGLSFDGSFALGYGAALLSAFTWAAYSLLSRRFETVPTDAVTGFCAVTAVFSLICHLGLEQTIWPKGTYQWLSIVGLGLLPVGAAFYAWDFGVKHGDIKVLGSASYAAPLFSTLILVASGAGQADWRIAFACILITGGGVLAAKDLLFAPACREEKTDK